MMYIVMLFYACPNVSLINYKLIHTLVDCSDGTATEDSESTALPEDHSPPAPPSQSQNLPTQPSEGKHSQLSCSVGTFSTIVRNLHIMPPYLSP